MDKVHLGGGRDIISRIPQRDVTVAERHLAAAEEALRQLVQDGAEDMRPVIQRELAEADEVLAAALGPVMSSDRAGVVDMSRAPSPRAELVVQAARTYRRMSHLRRTSPLVGEGTTLQELMSGVRFTTAAGRECIQLLRAAAGCSA